MSRTVDIHPSGFVSIWTLIAFYDNHLYFTPTVTLSRLSLLENSACNIIIHVVQQVPSPLRRNEKRSFRIPIHERLPSSLPMRRYRLAATLAHLNRIASRSSTELATTRSNIILTHFYLASRQWPTT